MTAHGQAMAARASAAHLKLTTEKMRRELYPYADISSVSAASANP